MYVLVMKVENLDKEIRLAGPRKAPLLEKLENLRITHSGRIHYRWWNNGWCDGSPDAWRHIQLAEGPGEIVLYG